MAGTQSTYTPQRAHCPSQGPLPRLQGGPSLEKLACWPSVCHDGPTSGPLSVGGPHKGGLSDLWGSRCCAWQARSSQRLPLLPRALSLPAWGPPGVAVGWVMGYSAQWVLMEPGGGTKGLEVTLPGFKPDSHTYLTVGLCLRPPCLVWSSSAIWK